MENEKLIERLKDLEACAYGYNINGEVLGMDCSDFEQIMVDAADTISMLQTENDRLRSDVNRFNDILASYQNVLVPELRAELDAYRTGHCAEGGCAAEKDRDAVIRENEKLRAELETVKADLDGLLAEEDRVPFYPFGGPQKED